MIMKRNFQLKMDVVKQLIDLQKTEAIRDVEAAIKKLQNDWEEIGPVANEEWEGLKESYWKNRKKVKKECVKLEMWKYHKKLS